MGKGSTIGILILIGLGLFILRKSNFQTFSNSEVQTLQPDISTTRISGASRGLTSTITSNIDNFARRLINNGINNPTSGFAPLGTGKFIPVKFKQIGD